MLSKKQRIPRKLFKPLLESRRHFNSQHFSLRVAPSKGFRVAVSVSKKVSKKAVVRNKIRRRAYSVISHLAPYPTNKLFLLIAKPGVGKTKGQELKEELSTLFKKG